MAVIPYFVLGLVAILVFVLNAAAQLRTIAKRESELLAALLARRRSLAANAPATAPATIAAALQVNETLQLREDSGERELFSGLNDAVARQLETGRAAVLKYNAVAAKPFFHLIGFRPKEEY